MEKFLYPKRAARIILTRPSESGKCYFLTNIKLNNNDEFHKDYIYSQSLHQGLYQKIK